MPFAVFSFTSVSSVFSLDTDFNGFFNLVPFALPDLLCFDDVFFSDLWGVSVFTEDVASVSYTCVLKHLIYVTIREIVLFLISLLRVFVVICLFCSSSLPLLVIKWVLLTFYLKQSSFKQVHVQFELTIASIEPVLKVPLKTTILKTVPARLRWFHLEMYDEECPD